jgi:hypothetical protein
MEYLVLSNVQVQQVPTDKYPRRNLLLVFSFMHKYEALSTWEDLTQTLSLVLPKNVKIKALNKSNYVQLGNINGDNSNLGGFDSEPVFLRGDMIKFNVGYRAVVDGGETTYMTGQKGIPDLFKGYISLVQPKLPFTLQCEDNMWLLKQMPTPAKNWGNISLQKITSTIIADSQNLPIITRYKEYVDLKVSDFSKTDLKFNVNNFTTTRGSLASMLARIKSQYRVDSYFRGDELRIGYLHYLPEDTVRHTFTFQKNILDNDKLKWQRMDDAVLSMVVKSNYRVESSGVTLDGVQESKHACTEILIYNNAGVFTYVTKEKGKDFPTKHLKDIGERFTMNIYDAISDPKKLFEIGKPQLEKYYYDGFKGSFTTFGIPYVKHGDTVQLVNKILPEQSGLYKVKAVRYFGGYDDGLRQEITLDYKI